MRYRGLRADGCGMREYSDLLYRVVARQSGGDSAHDDDGTAGVKPVRRDGQRVKRGGDPRAQKRFGPCADH